MTRRLLAALMGVVLALGIVTAIPPTEAAAVTGSQFDPGYIISDAEFFNGGAMTANDVQSFLNSKVPTCQSGYVCIKDFRQNTPNMPADAYCSGYAGAANERASDIIAKVGASCNINQRVLLVLLQKEQGLITHTWPSSWRYTSATGFGCPDTAPCDPTFNGFVYQIYYAARQFKRYAALPNNYNYRAGRVNNILYHPNAACGTQPVYIANQATAGLYNYTPYVPNAAALANMTGTGDSCSSYGNRNFWQFYWNWFGSPVTNAVFLRTQSNALVYLVSGGRKHPITSYDQYVSLLPLGGLSVVSQGYLDGYPTGPAVGSFFRSDSGTIAIFDRSTFFPFTSCAQIADFGSSCGSDNYVQLTDAMFAAFPKGPALSSVVGTVSGARYAVVGGLKREFMDAQAQTDAGFAPDFVVLSDSAVSYLGVGDPYVRENVFIRNRDNGAFYAFFDGALHALSAADATSLGIAAKATGSLNSASIARLPSGSPMTTAVKAADGTAYFLTATGRIESATAAATAITLPQAMLELFPVQEAPADGTLIKSADSAAVYVVSSGTLRGIPSWSALVSIAGTGPIVIQTVPKEVIASLPRGANIITSGTLVRTPSNATIFLIDGLGAKIPVSNFAYPAEAGINGFSFVSDSDLAAYTTAPSVLGFGYVCEGSNYVAGSGSLHLVTDAYKPSYPIEFTTVSSQLCATLPRGKPAGMNIRTPNGAIYQLRPDGKYSYTYSQWVAVGSAQGWLGVHQYFADLIPTRGFA